MKGGEEVKTETSVPTLLGKIDIAKRWGVTKQLLAHRISNHKDFPKPIATISNGKTALFDIEDIIIYERRRGFIPKQHTKNRKEDSK